MSIQVGDINREDRVSRMGARLHEAPTMKGFSCDSLTIYPYICPNSSLQGSAKTQKWPSRRSPGCLGPGPPAFRSAPGAAPQSSPAVINRRICSCPWAALWHSSLRTVQLAAARIRASAASRRLFSRSGHPRWETNMTQSGRNTDWAGVLRRAAGSAGLRAGEV